MWVLICCLKRNRLCGNTRLVCASSRRMDGLRRSRAPLAKYVSGQVTSRLSTAQIKSNRWTSALLSSNYHARLGPIWQLNLLSKNINGKGKVVCGAKKLQGLNLNANPKLSFIGKLSHWDVNQPICKGGLISLYQSGAPGCPHGPDAQSYTPHHKMPFITINNSLL